jgi:menaquinone-dependent protoporphyrinogen oxidase
MEATTQPKNPIANILLIYSSTDGHTKKISLTLKKTIEKHRHHVTVLPLEDAAATNISDFDKIVIGASVRYGKHSSLIVDFIESNRASLETRPNAFFSVNVVARKPEKKDPENNPYLQKFLKRLSWEPNHLEVIAGKIDYPSYRFIDRVMIQMIMWMTKGPTEANAVIEYTDWDQVEKFGNKISAM